MVGRVEVCLDGATGTIPRGNKSSEVGVARTPVTAVCMTREVQSAMNLLSCIMTGELSGTMRRRKERKSAVFPNVWKRAALAIARVPSGRRSCALDIDVKNDWSIVFREEGLGIADHPDVA